MIERQTTALWCMLLTVLTLTACHDDEDMAVPAGTDWTVSVVGSTGSDIVFSRLASFERLVVDIDGYDAERDGAVVVSSTADWLTVLSDTLSTDSIVVLTTTTNDDAARRSASLVFTAEKNRECSASLTVNQLSESDLNTNSGDARSVLYVGYGYDIYAALDNPMSVRTKRPILDIGNLRANSGIFNFEAIHDSRLSTINTRTYSASTLEELSRTLTGTSSNADVEIAGSLQTCMRTLTAASEVKVSEQNVGYGVLTKTVASRVIDKGVLTFLLHYDTEEGIENSNRLSLSYEFKQLLNTIRKKRGDDRRQAVTNLLLEYGTHIVVQADLGGKLDYTFTMDRSRSFRPDAEAAEEVRYTVGQISKADRTEGLKEVSSKKNVSGAIQVWGGSAASRALLQQDINALDKQGQIAPIHMQEWLASINYSVALAADADLDVVHFELMPLWDLVAPDLRQDFLDATLLLAQRSDCKLPDTVLGTDIYKLDTSDKALFDFSNVGDDRSLCRILYYENEPVLQVCSEYVPKIRTDARVIMAYPIFRQHIHMNDGLFIGDGIHQPAFVSFSGQDCYVNPIDSIRPGAVVRNFYYVNGTLMMINPSGSVKSDSKKRAVRDDAFYYLYSGRLNETPIVKIGSLFWTRRDIDHLMGFCRNAKAQKATYEQYVVDGTLYTQFYRDVYSRAQKDNYWIWGNNPNTMYPGNPNRLWFLPSTADLETMNAYLGFNPKALFRGQTSGFNASFSGYYGIHDFVNKRSFGDGQKAVRYKDELFIFASYHGESDADVEMLVLRKDYSMELMKVNGDWHRDYFPVRAVRGYLFDYPMLTTIQSNTL